MDLKVLDFHPQALLTWSGKLHQIAINARQMKLMINHNYWVPIFRQTHMILYVWIGSLTTPFNNKDGRPLSFAPADPSEKRLPNSCPHLPWWQLLQAQHHRWVIETMDWLCAFHRIQANSQIIRLFQEKPSNPSLPAGRRSAYHCAFGEVLRPHG